MKAKLLFILGVCFFTSASAFGQVVITLDENGNANINGSPVPGTVAVDPTNGTPTLSYFSPAATVAVPGDLILVEPAPLSTQLTDVVRFLRAPGGGTQVLFYSDLEAGTVNKDLADVGLPANAGDPAIGPSFTATEIGPEPGPNGITYTPTPNQPGYFPINTAGAGPTYVIVSDTPEPASAAILLGAAGFLTLARRRATRQI